MVKNIDLKNKRHICDVTEIIEKILGKDEIKDDFYLEYLLLELYELIILQKEEYIFDCILEICKYLEHFSINNFQIYI